MGSDGQVTVHRFTGDLHAANEVLFALGALFCLVGRNLDAERGIEL